MSQMSSAIALLTLKRRRAAVRIQLRHGVPPFSRISSSPDCAATAGAAHHAECRAGSYSPTVGHSPGMLLRSVSPRLAHPSLSLLAICGSYSSRCRSVSRETSCLALASAGSCGGKDGEGLRQAAPNAHGHRAHLMRRIRASLSPMNSSACAFSESVRVLLPWPRPVRSEVLPLGTFSIVVLEGPSADVSRATSVAGPPKTWWPWIVRHCRNGCISPASTSVGSWELQCSTFAQQEETAIARRRDVRPTTPRSFVALCAVAQTPVPCACFT